MQLRRALESAFVVIVAVTASRALADPPGDPPADTAPEDSDPGTDTDDATGAPITGTARLGVYTDTDRTRVYRLVTSVAHAWGDHWAGNAGVDIDVVSSASLDVRTSPLGNVDIVTTASGRQREDGGSMSDRRIQASAGGSWTDGSGHTVASTVTAAKEHDYFSLSAGLNGQYDVLGRTTTLLGGVTITRNWISSVLDDTFAKNLTAVGWSLGVARVLTPYDAIRLRYDGEVSEGYHASPYRNVRFGDWMTATNEDTGQISFTNTIGSADGLPETEPERRIKHAATLELVHSLASDVGLHAALRGTRDSWGVTSLTPSLDLRIAKPRWRAQIGYRYYFQSRADFFADKYAMDPSAYTYFSSDKDLGDERGHLVRLSAGYVLLDSASMTDSRLLLDFQLELAHYDYPGFTLLPSRDSLFALIGLSLEL